MPTNATDSGQGISTDKVLTSEFSKLENGVTAIYAGIPEFSAIEARLFCISAMIVLITMSMKPDEATVQEEIDRFAKYGTYTLYVGAKMDAGDDGTRLLQLENAFRHRHSVYGQLIFDFVRNQNAESGLQMIANMDSRIVPKEERGVFSTGPAFSEMNRLLHACGNALWKAHRP